MLFQLAEYEARLEKVRALMESRGVDILVVSTPENIYYLSGFDSPGYYQFQAMALESGGRPDALYVRNLEASLIADTSWVKDVRTYRLETDDIVGGLADLIKGYGAAGKRVGIEKDSWFMRVAEYERLVAAIPEARFVDASALVGEVRIVKSPAEIACIRKAAGLSDLGIQAAINAIHEGATEAEVAAACMNAIILAGSDYTTMPFTFGSGRRSVYVHGTHDPDKVIRMGDVVAMEFSGCYRRYNSNLMRTAVVGEPSDTVKKVYDVNLRASEAALAVIRPGVHPGEVHAAAHRVIEAAGLGPNQLHRTGYSAGLGYPPVWIEPMTLSHKDPHILQAGMTLAIEPTIYLDEFSTRLGENVLVTETGCEALTKTGRQLHVR